MEKADNYTNWGSLHVAAEFIDGGGVLADVSGCNKMVKRYAYWNTIVTIELHLLPYG